jgi:hypothetical protein
MSQKALALEAYTKHADNWNTTTQWPVLRTVKVQLVPVGEDIPVHINPFIDEKVEDILAGVRMNFDSEDYPLFVRACPLNPRPGVLESSRADTTEDVAIIARRIINIMMSPDPSDKPMYDSGLIDPNGMLIVQPFINATASAVVAPNNYILMGRDNDGITAGKDGLQVAIPLGNDPNVNMDFNQLSLDPNHIEIEFVSERKQADLEKSVRNSNGHVQQRVAMVQLRGSEGHRPIAPSPKGVDISGTFHGAERITINHIHLVSDNTDEQLDKMEQALREGMPEGSVVLHPNGSHLSHHAGQCFKYGVPYIASSKPQVGEQWTQAALGWVVLDNDGTYKPQPYDPLDFIASFIEGFDIGFSNHARLHGWLSNHFHQFIGGPIGDAEQTAKLAGAYMSWLINATLSVGLGELRHTYSNAKDSTALVMATVHAIYGEDAWAEVTHTNYLPEHRREYYTMVERAPVTLESVISLFQFMEKVYSLSWASSYGGEKYRISCENGRLLAEATRKFFANTSKKNFKEMLSVANLVEHNVHNTGFFFNKFLAKSALDWGTNPDTVRVVPQDFFSVYYAADHIMQSYPHTLWDFTDIIEVARGITINDMKKTPLAKMDNIIGASMKYLLPYHRHPNGKYSQVTSSNFLQCGLDNCGVCTNHSEYMKQSVTSNILPITESHDAPFPVDTTSEAAIIISYKSLSKNIGEHTPSALALLMKHHPAPSAAQKYVALIVSQFTSEQLQEFAKHHAGDE